MFHVKHTGDKASVPRETRKPRRNGAEVVKISVSRETFAEKQKKIFGKALENSCKIKKVVLYYG